MDNAFFVLEQPQQRAIVLVPNSCGHTCAGTTSPDWPSSVRRMLERFGQPGEVSAYQNKTSLHKISPAVREERHLAIEKSENNCYVVAASARK